MHAATGNLRVYNLGELIVPFIPNLQLSKASDKWTFDHIYKTVNTNKL